MNIIEPIIDSNIAYIISNNRQNLYLIDQDNNIFQVNLNGLSTQVSVNGVVYLANRIRDIVVFQDTLVIGGDFGLKYWNISTQQWERLAIFTAGSSSFISNALFPNSVFKLAVSNNKLYILGNFVNAQTQTGGNSVSSPYIVAFNGESFQSVIRKPALPPINVSSLIPKSSSYIYANDNVVSLYVHNNNIFILNKGFFDGRNLTIGTRGSSAFTDIAQNGSSTLYTINSDGILTTTLINGNVINDYRAGDELFFVGLVQKNNSTPQTIYSKLNLNNKTLSRAYDIVNFDGTSSVTNQVAASVINTGVDTYNVSSSYIDNNNYKSDSLYEFPALLNNYQFKKVINNISVYGGLNSSLQPIDNYEKSRSALFIDSANRLWSLMTSGHNIPLSQETRFGSGMVLYDLDYGQLKLNGSIKQAVLGLDTIMVLTANGEIYAWGSNSYGQLGGDIPIGSSIDTPIKIEGDNYDKLYCKNHTFYAIKKDGSMYAWGRNKIQFASNSNAFIYMIPGFTTDFVQTPIQVNIEIGLSSTPVDRLGQELNSDMGQLWEMVSIGPFSIYAIDKFGLLYHWGGMPNVNIASTYIQPAQTNANAYIKSFNSGAPGNTTTTEPILLGCPAWEGTSVTGSDPGKYLFIDHDSTLISTRVGINNIILDGHIAIFSYEKNDQTYTEIWDKNIVDRDVETSTNFTTQAGINSIPTSISSNTAVSNTKSLSYNNIYSNNLKYLEGYKELLVKFMFCDTYNILSSSQIPSPSIYDGRTNIRLGAIDKDDILRLESSINFKWDYITKNKKWQSFNPYYAIDEFGNIFVLPYGGNTLQAYPFVYPYRLLIENIDNIISSNKICDLTSTSSVISDMIILNNKIVVGGHIPLGNNFYSDRHLVVYDLNTGLVLDLDIPTNSIFSAQSVNQLIPLSIRDAIAPPPTPSNTPSVSPTNTTTPSQTPTVSQSSTTTPTPTETPTNTPTISESATNTPTPSITRTLTPTRTPTKTPTATPTITKTSTPRGTSTPTVTSSKSPTPTTTKTPTNSQTLLVSWKRDGQHVQFSSTDQDGVIPLNCDCLADEFNRRNTND